MNYPPRLARLHRDLINGIPCRPDRADVRAELAALPLPDLLVKYTGWADRLIPTRKRSVVYAKNFWNRSALEHTAAVIQIAKEIEAGEDLLPRLSLRVRTEGHMPARFDRAGRRQGPEWGDKDFALNAYDLHHLHLGESGRKGRPLLYAHFTRGTAAFLFVGDHKSFDDGSAAQAAARWHTGGKDVRMPRDAKSLDRLHRAGISTLNVADGRVFIGTAISSDGSSTAPWAAHLWRVLKQVEPTLDDPARRQQLFANSGRSCPDDPDFIWQMRLCDIELLEMRSRTGFTCDKWQWRR